MINIGDNVRIDDFSILSGNITLGSHIHISAGTYLFAGNAGIEMEDFTGISSHSSIYAISDDYSGNVLIGATISKKYKNIKEKKVYIKKHSQVGAACTILPGTTIETGCAIGANSLLLKSTKAWSIYFGSPAKFIKPRSQNLLLLEKEFLSIWNNQNHETL